MEKFDKGMEIFEKDMDKSMKEQVINLSSFMKREETLQEDLESVRFLLKKLKERETWEGTYKDLLKEVEPNYIKYLRIFEGPNGGTLNDLRIMNLYYWRNRNVEILLQIRNIMAAHPTTMKKCLLYASKHLSIIMDLSIEISLEYYITLVRKEPTIHEYVKAGSL